MSLKAFHVLFIAVAMILALGFGIWAVFNYRSTGDVGSLLWGIASWIGFVGLGAYGRWFLRKLRKESYL